LHLFDKIEAALAKPLQHLPGLLVVDYIGIAQNLKSALGQYSSVDREQVGIDEAGADRIGDNREYYRHGAGRL
jgi:hypothetical protein